MNMFGILAGYYDMLNDNAGYKKTADYIEKVFRIYNLHKLYKKKPDARRAPLQVLDLACGTGSLAIELAARGYDMTGLDLSADMLAIASAKNPGILWLNQDMRGFELYGTVGAIICCYDSLNYILEKKDVKKCFKLAYNYLDPGGLFIFDVNSKHRFENIFARNNFVLENKNKSGNQSVFCSWQNYYDKKSKICEFDINIFSEQPDGRYKRYGEIQRERYHSEKFLKRALTEAGFGRVDIFYDFKADNKKYNKYKNSERICFVCSKSLKQKLK